MLEQAYLILRSPAQWSLSENERWFSTRIIIAQHPWPANELPDIVIIDDNNAIIVFSSVDISVEVNKEEAAFKTLYVFRSIELSSSIFEIIVSFAIFPVFLSRRNNSNWKAL